MKLFSLTTSLLTGPSWASWVRTLRLLVHPLPDQQLVFPKNVAIIDRSLVCQPSSLDVLFRIVGPRRVTLNYTEMSAVNGDDATRHRLIHGELGRAL